jgi:hypothetical protein
MVRQLENPLLLNRVLDLAKNIPDMDTSVLGNMLTNALASKKAVILVSETREGELNGFAFATIENLDGEDAVFIQATYIKPEDEKYTGFEFMTKMRLFGKDNRLNNIYMMTKRNPKAYMRKYKFEFAYTVLRRRIIDERSF